MAGNGLELKDFNMTVDEINAIVAEIEEVEINQLTKEQVLAAYEKWWKEQRYATREQAGQDIATLAKFIFVNGTHDSISGEIRIDENLKWGVLKARTGFRPTMKSMFLRWCSPLMSLMATEFNKDKFNLMWRLASKYEIEDEFDQIPLELRYFGGYYNYAASNEDRSKILSYQKKIIELSSPSSTTLVPAKRSRGSN